MRPPSCPCFRRSSGRWPHRPSRCVPCPNARFPEASGRAPRGRASAAASDAASRTGMRPLCPTRAAAAFSAPRHHGACIVDQNVHAAPAPGHVLREGFAFWGQGDVERVKPHLGALAETLALEAANRLSPSRQHDAVLAPGHQHARQGETQAAARARDEHDSFSWFRGARHGRVGPRRKADFSVGSLPFAC